MMVNPGKLTSEHGSMCAAATEINILICQKISKKKKNSVYISILYVSFMKNDIFCVICKRDKTMSREKPFLAQKIVFFAHDKIMLVMKCLICNKARHDDFLSEKRNTPTTHDIEYNKIYYWFQEQKKHHLDR